MSIPVVAIVGRPNVGKSALFNRIAGKKISLVYDRPGVTRDRVVMPCKWRGKPFCLLDTGGIGLEDESGFEEAIQREVQVAMEKATVILLVLDGREGLQVLDEQVALRLRKARCRVLPVVNKMDSDKQDHLESDFATLGFERAYPVSAAHGRGIRQLMDDLSRDWEVGEHGESTQDEAPREMEKVAVVGKPNVGKSSLINALLNEERLIVSPIAGTTRDAVDVELTHGKRHFQFIDTAGMRKRTRLHDHLEKAMTGRSAHAINRCDLAVLAVDAEQGVGEQEKKIGSLIQRANKPCIILINKWDLALKAHGRASARSIENFRKEYETSAREQLFFLSYASMIFVSAKEGNNLGRFLGELERLSKSRRARIGTGLLNRILAEAIDRHPPPRKGRLRFKLYYATQVPDEKVSAPTITAFVNRRELLNTTYLRYLEQQVRNEFPCPGCPIVWEFKEKPPKE